MIAPRAASAFAFGTAARSSFAEVKIGRISWPVVERVVLIRVALFFWVPVTSTTKKPSRSARSTAASRS